MSVSVSVSEERENIRAAIYKFCVSMCICVCVYLIILIHIHQLNYLRVVHRLQNINLSAQGIQPADLRLTNRLNRKPLPRLTVLRFTDHPIVPMANLPRVNIILSLDVPIPPRHISRGSGGGGDCTPSLGDRALGGGGGGDLHGGGLGVFVCLGLLLVVVGGDDGGGGGDLHDLAFGVDAFAGFGGFVAVVCVYVCVFV